MSERYDDVAAAHYAAYRPPLHELILRRVLGERQRFARGLDVGCGTGRSAVALAEHCRAVYAVDPSPEMLRRATSHERVRYAGGSAERIPLASGAFDVATFAGSLFYADAAAAAAEVVRACRGGGIVVVYDFEVLLREMLERLGVEPLSDVSDYDHGVNFAGAPGLHERSAGTERLALEVTAAELAHVLLSDSHVFDALTARFGGRDPYEKLVAELGSDSGLGAGSGHGSDAERIPLEADIWFAEYGVG